MTNASPKSREPAYQARFQKDYALMERRGKKVEKLDKILDDLITGRPLAPIHKDHALGHNWAGYRDCHIEGDWVLIYRIDPIPEDAQRNDGPAERVTFARTGTHSDLFG